MDSISLARRHLEKLRKYFTDRKTQIVTNTAHEDAVDGAQMHKAMRALDYRSLLVKPRPVKLYYKLDKEKLTIQLGKHLNEMLFKLI